MRVLMPIPKSDFDPTESGVPWKVSTDRGIDVVFATPDGEPAAADPRMVEGTGLGPWRPVLRADARGREAYRAMTQSDAFRSPLSWEEVEPADFDGLILPGGHANGMRSYLESQTLQSVVLHFMDREAPLGAICHGVVLLARSKRDDGESVLRGRRATALLRSQELSAWAMTALWLGSYYRTYPTTVEDEVREALGDRGHFESGPFALFRDDPDHLNRGFVVRDGNLITARWPGDAHRFAAEFHELLSSGSSL